MDTSRQTDLDNVSYTAEIALHMHIAHAQILLTMQFRMVS